ncbi:site-specific integrase [Domibacillus indicus]|uniref:site-specific integrase n=1 Tax=Domibacillus indicus TaxID=1437523 RepID=UPI00203FEE1A|nr:site-specific integrase [Domibacillus indicus]
MIILLLAYTGLRVGGSMGLTWNDIDFEKKTLTVNKTRDRHGTRAPKTKRSYRTILVDDFIFISPFSGEPSIDNVLQTCFQRICGKAGLKRIAPHGLHYTHATLLIS